MLDFLLKFSNSMRNIADFRVIVNEHTILLRTTPNIFEQCLWLLELPYTKLRYQANKY